MEMEIRIFKKYSRKRRNINLDLYFEGDYDFRAKILAFLQRYELASASYQVVPELKVKLFNMLFKVSFIGVKYRVMKNFSVGLVVRPNGRKRGDAVSGCSSSVLSPL